MYNINKIKIDKKPRSLILKKLPELKSNILMSEFDSAFICGLLEEYKPRKILEIGAAFGGTTAVILQCMKKIGVPFVIHSTDILKHRKNNKKKFIKSLKKEQNKSIYDIGWIGKKAAESLKINDLHIWCGNYIPSIIEQIGGSIDFVILDTMHLLPGEVLDFLAILPFLSPNAIVCFHDIKQNHKTHPDPSQIATNCLFNSVVAEKYLNNDIARSPDFYPNIGAIKINNDTLKYINNVIGILTQNWTYMLDDNTLNLYRQIIEKYYPEESLWLFDKAIAMNKKSFKKRTNLQKLILRIKKKLRS